MIDVIYIQTERTVFMEGADSAGVLFVEGAASAAVEIAVHEAKPDPHPQYQLRTEKDASGGYAGLSGYSVTVKSPGGAVASALASEASAPRAWTLPDKDGTLAVQADVDAGDASALASAQSYADSLVVGLWDDRGSYDASGNTFPAAGGSGPLGAILKGDIWTISVAGTLGGVAVNVSDTVRALVDAPGQTAANWDILEHGIGYVPENAANKGVAGGYASLDGNAKLTLAQTRRLVRTAVKTGAYTAAAFDLVPVDVSGGSVALNLPNAPEDSTRLAFKLIAVAGSNTATVSTQGADVFNKAGGTTTLSLSLLNQAAVVEYDAATHVWTIVSNDLPLAQMDARYSLKPAYAVAADGVTITPALIASDTTRVDQTNTQAAGTLTLANPTGSPADGEILIVRATCTNAQTLAFGTSYRGTNQLSLPSATTGGGRTDRMVWEYKSAAAKWDLIGISFGA